MAAHPVDRGVPVRFDSMPGTHVYHTQEWCGLSRDLLSLPFEKGGRAFSRLAVDQSCIMCAGASCYGQRCIHSRATMYRLSLVVSVVVVV